MNLDLDSIVYHPPILELPEDATLQRKDYGLPVLSSLGTKTRAIRAEPCTLSPCLANLYTVPHRRGFDQLHEQVAALAAVSEETINLLGPRQATTRKPPMASPKIKMTPRALPHHRMASGSSLSIERGGSKTFITEVDPSKYGLTHSPSRLLRPVEMSKREAAAVIYRDELVSRSKAGRLESAYFPGSDAIQGIHYLPGGVDIKSFLHHIKPPTTVTREMKQRRDAWKSMVKSKEHICITRDAFWWFFLQHFRGKCRGGPGTAEDDPSGTVQAKESLFGRIASNFVDLLLSIDHKHRHVVSDQYADALGESVHAAFTTTFPKSSAQFNAHFCTDLVATIHEWVSGFRPHDPTPQWETAVPKLEESEKVKVVPPLKLRAVSRAPDGKLPAIPPPLPRPRAKHPSTIAGRLPRREQSVMDIYGTSPLVSYYLSQKRVPRANPKPFFLRRTENATESSARSGMSANRVGNSPGSLTYRDIQRASNWTQKHLNQRYMASLEKARKNISQRYKTEAKNTIPVADVGEIPATARF